MITLNRGAKHGVNRYMAVAAQQAGITGLVGKVVSVAGNSCTIIPLFNENSFVAARLEAQRYDGLISGQGEQSKYLVMQNIERQARSEIQYGDMVVTSGLGRVFPKDIPIGRVRLMSLKAYETSVELQIEPIIDFSRLEYVLILTNEG